MHRFLRPGAVLGACISLAMAYPCGAQSEPTGGSDHCTLHDPLRNPYFGDAHVHTVLSFDAWGQGTRNTPADAYRFAKGETVGIQPYDRTGEPLRTVQLRRPLDFAVVTDHAEMLGETHFCRTPGAPGHDSLVCVVTRRWPKLGYMIVNSQIYDVRDPQRYSFCGDGGRVCIEGAATPWREIQEAAEEAYDRSGTCAFTSFVGYEWTGNPDSSMIHRNVVFRNEVVPRLPATYIEEKTGAALWRHLKSECLDAGNGCDVVVIPHNSNLSNGLLFRVETEAGANIQRADAELRASLEVLVEVTQHKGDSECRAGGGSTDELCGFETLPFARMMESVHPLLWSEIPPLVYVRETLAEGLVQHARIGANPFKLGLIGSTDTHLGTPGLVAEDRFVGHAAGTVTSRLEIPPLPDSPIFNPGGLAVLWAEENTRDALFDAMQRRETYGTSGPRMRVRFFGGWDGPDDRCEAPDFVARGYAHGVPMGGDLPPRPAEAAAPTFAVWALKDAGTPDRPGTALQRLQIVKTWEEDGAARERVYEVAGEPDNGADVDPASCEPRGRGFEQLCATWTDPDFAPDQHAAWYARVVENPSCRWTTHACLASGAPCPDDVPRTIQERAWTSPIWFTPRSESGDLVDTGGVVADDVPQGVVAQ